MKKTIFALFLASAVAFTGCNNNDDVSDALFVTGTLVNNSIKFAVDGQSSIGITVSSTAKAQDDMKVRLKAAPELLEQYNAENGSTYQVPPADAYKLEDTEVTIKRGTSQSTQAKLNADGDKFAEGVSYCLPVTIMESDNGMDAIAAARTVYVRFTKVIRIKAANLANRGGFDVMGFMKDANGNSPVKELGQMTLEMKVFPVSFGHGLPANNGGSISSLVGCEENFLFRFGDGAGQPFNKLQLSVGKIGKETYDSWVDTPFETGHWIHFAAVYDGSALRIYVDGELRHSVNTKGGNIDLSESYPNTCFAIGRSAGVSRFFDGYVSECRVWNVARSVDELNAGICYVDPTSPGLIAYWRFNGEEQPDGSVLDETGHGYNATKFGTVSYVDNQKCPW